MERSRNQFQGNVDKDINQLSLYVLYVDNNSLIEYLPGDWQKIGFKKGIKMKLKLVMPGGNLKEIGSDEIEEQLKTGLKKLTFEMEETFLLKNKVALMFY